MIQQNNNPNPHTKTSPCRVFNHFDNRDKVDSKVKNCKIRYNACPYCGEHYRLNVVNSRQNNAKALRTGCCDIFIRWCPSPEELLKRPNLTPEHRVYLQKVASLEWYGGQIATVLLDIEAKSQQAEVAE